MANLRTHTAEIADQLSDHLDMSTNEIEERLESLVTEYHVPVDEARQSVVNSYLDEAGIECDELAGGSGGNKQTLLNGIDKGEQWVDARAKVVGLWEPRSESIAQVDLPGDDSGRMEFVPFITSELPELEEGESYALGNVVANEYRDNFSVKFSRTANITEFDEEIEVGGGSASVEGTLVDSQSGSGLIEHCPEEGCTRVPQNGRCSERGSVEGEFDLRIKAVVDDDDEVHEVISSREVTEELTDIELDEMRQMAMDAFDTTIVEEGIRGGLVGYYHRVTGPMLGRYVLADEVEWLHEPADTEELLIRARSM